MKLPASLLYGLITCILLVSAPHADHLPLWLVALSIAVLAWRSYLARTDNALPPRWLLLFITLAGTGGILIEFHTLFGRDAGVALLIMLATLKLMELRSSRDATVLLYLSSFIIITNFFYSQSIPTALFMLLTLLVILATWVHLHAGALALRPRLRIAGVLLLQAIPLTLLLFVLFPRVQGPLWGMPQDAYAQSGLDDKMAPGSMSRLSLSDAVAFRVVFSGTPPLHDQMYWRGPVLTDYDGRTWTQGPDVRSRKPEIETGGGATVDYTVTLEPHNKPWLFALEMPIQVSVPARLGYDFQLLSRTPVSTRLRYEARSQLGYRANVEESAYQLQRALALPPGLNPRARQLAAEWRASKPNDEAIMLTALSYFNREGYTYTLQPPLLGANAVDDFLFGAKKGFCEHYASSFVFLMRAAGVPARVVTGYQGGELNDLGGYYIVRQSDAHAWAEVWLQGRGWVRTDPTAAIAPSRVQSGLNAALPDNAALPFMARTQSPLLLRLRLNLDALTNQWNQWVLGYNTERQFALLTRLGMEDISWQKMARSLLLGIALLVGVIAALMLWRLYRQQHDPAHALYLKFCRKLEHAGLQRAAHEGPWNFALRAANALPAQANTIHDITGRYLALRYGPAAGADELTALRRAISAFRL